MLDTGLVKRYDCSIIALVVQEIGSYENIKMYALLQGSAGEKMTKTMIAAWSVAVVVVIAAFGNARIVILMDAVRKNDGNLFEVLNKVSHGVLISGNESRGLSSAETEEIVHFMKELRVYKREINQSRDIARDKSYQIRFTCKDDLNTDLTLGIDFNFNADFTAVWMNNGVKPSFSYTVAEPQAAKRFFECRWENITARMDFDSCMAW